MTKLHPNDEGTRIFFGKPYIWTIGDNGRLRLRPLKVVVTESSEGQSTLELAAP